MQRRSRVHRRSLRIAVLLPALAACLACASTGALSGPWPEVTRFPAADWDRATPEAEGLAPASLADFLDAVTAEHLPVHGVLVVRHGAIVLDVAFPPFQRSDRHDVASVTKSVTATLVGLALARRELAGLDQPLVTLFPELLVADVDPRKRALTLADLLTMRSGLACDAPGGGDLPTLLAMMRSPDWAAFTLGLPLAHEPGTRFGYCSPVSHLLAVALRRATGVSALDYARRHLFGPLGIVSADWPVDATSGDPHGWGDLALTRHDLARLGLLYLAEGRWGDTRVLPREWVRAALSPQVELAPQGPLDGYGYQWWTSSLGLGVARGRGDQWLIVAPRLGLVVVLTGTSSDRDSARKAELVRRFLLGAVRSDGALPPDPEGAERLRRSVACAEAADDPAALPAPTVSGPSRPIDGASYALADNAYGLRHLALASPESSRVHLSLGPIDGATLEVDAGLDGAWRTRAGRRGYPVRARARWEDGATLTVEIDELALINRWTLQLRFEGDSVRGRLVDASGNPAAALEGTRRSPETAP